jgi:solanesyl diphosphate synthase
MWTQKPVNGSSTHKHKVQKHDINASSLAIDPLDDWHLDRTTRYWPGLPPNVSKQADPFVLAEAELSSLSQTIKNDLLGTDHPVLNQAARYFFDSADGGKKVRPMMVLLLSRALSETVHPSSSTSNTVLLEASSLQPWQRHDLPQSQRRLAEICEMIHTASLFHDDVIDGADTRRGAPAVHTVFGNKMAILAGDYLLARASISLARLQNPIVVECMSTIIEHLVRGEVMQLSSHTSSSSHDHVLEYYLRKNFFKTASLMANSCKSAALLGNYSTELVQASYEYGKHVGMAFQLVDDVLDFEGSAESLGKPALSDLQAGLATAPVLFALNDNTPDASSLLEMMQRKFRQEGDVEQTCKIVKQSNGMERTKELAQVHAELAMDAALQLGDSVHRDALVHLAYKVVDRTR